MASDKCRDCGGENMVWDWSCGDIVCTKCGLVAVERFIDDRVGWKEYGQYSPLREEEGDGVVDKNVAEFLEKYHGASDISPVGMDAVDIMDSVEKGTSTTDICGALNIKTKQMWKMAEEKKIVGKDRSYDMIKRIVYECEGIPSARAWDVIKAANRFREAVLGCKGVAQGVKIDRLVVSLVVIACCDICKIPGVSVGALCSKYGLAMGTFRKHERMLQGVLERDGVKVSVK